MISIMDYLDNFWGEVNDYRTSVKPEFSLPAQKKLFLTEIEEFLNDYRISSTDICITFACKQLEEIIEKCDVIIDMDFEKTNITNPFKTRTMEKAIKKGELSSQRKVG